MKARGYVLGRGNNMHEASKGPVLYMEGSKEWSEKTEREAFKQ